MRGKHHGAWVVAPKHIYARVALGHVVVRRTVGEQMVEYKLHVASTHALV